MAKGTPSSAFYWNDYYRDTRVLTLPTRAIWMDMLCRAHESHTRGEITLSVGAWARWCACDTGAIVLAEVELRRHPEVGEVERQNMDKNGSMDYETNVFLTVRNRRMVREQTAKHSNAKRQKKFYDKQKPNDTQTPVQTTPNTVPSSSSSLSSSSSVKKKTKRETLAMPENWSMNETMKGYAIEKGMTTPTLPHEFEKCKLHHAQNQWTEKGWSGQIWQTWVLNWISFGSKQVTPQSAPITRHAICTYDAEARCEAEAIIGSKYCQEHKARFAPRQETRRSGPVVVPIHGEVKELIQNVLTGKSMSGGR